ncbi:hypothetical protein HYPSUDRAFT_79852 [Hypholoma sublateritium FD-334 SS-4]|uniref:Uncharacterized protein n=1 Tax=Hypholoma sublateritium (strain FD-334 SS-4) TaxID=945553 RepID=A0A0D2NK28_HYPSF|nr:hypothetical protein HYPSUDRAFT_79852 [Hypholoma sublateritium FD-334 SS-4]
MAFPPLSRAYIRAFQFSAWYPIFARESIASTVVRPLAPAFRAYLDADGVFVPAGSEDLPGESTLSDSDSSSSSEDDDEDDEKNPKGKEKAPPAPKYAFPELDAQIRAAVRAHGGGVFPKLNFSAPQDAAWLLPAGAPLRCTAPADVYLLLKASDFVAHDLDPEAVFARCDAVQRDAEGGGEGGGEIEKQGEAEDEPYELELVLRKWYAVDRARELRCFVRGDRLVAIAQRDPNFYPFWTDRATQTRVARAVRRFWRTRVRARWPAQKDYVLDLLLTRDLARAHIVDFNPYHPKTDPLLFTYDELHALYLAACAAEAAKANASDDPTVTTTPKDAGHDKNDTPSADDAPGVTGDTAANDDTTPTDDAKNEDDEEEDDASPLPTFRIIETAAHPAANRNAPKHQHNMIPFEAATMSSGHDIEQFAEMWRDSVRKGMHDSDSDDGGDAD